MMATQISAYIKDDIKEKMEKYSATHGLKKGFLIESAIEYYLQAMYEIPANEIVPNSIVVDSENFEKLEKLNSKKPNSKLKKLLS